MGLDFTGRVGDFVLDAEGVYFWVDGGGGGSGDGGIADDERFWPQ